ncbi:MAG: AzlC family ABC transporter permease [Trueperaceae bacterium]
MAGTPKNDGMTFGDGFREGMRDALPILLAVTPFGLVVGVAAVEVGLPVAQAIGMSYVVYAGTAQLAALQLIAVGSPVAVILVTTLLLNLRFVLYSAAFAPHLRAAPGWLRVVMAFLMTDQSMALGSQRYGRFPERGAKVAHYLGVAVPMGVVWTTSSTLGVLLGAGLPAGLSLEFAVPLVFLTLWVAAMVRGTAPVWVAGAVAGGVAVLARPLPFNLGLLVAAFAGIAAGVYWETRRGPAPRPGGGTARRGDAP